MSGSANAPLPPPTTYVDEQAPLLGGDRHHDSRVQAPDEPLWRNLFSNTALIAQAGGVLFVLATYGTVFSHELILFSAHPVSTATVVFADLRPPLVAQNPLNRILILLDLEYHWGCPPAPVRINPPAYPNPRAEARRHARARNIEWDCYLSNVLRAYRHYREQGSSPWFVRSFSLFSLRSQAI
jgi:hypothetical protein